MLSRSAATIIVLVCAAAAVNAQTTTTLSDSNGTWTITTNPGGAAPNQIKIRFHPDANTVNCAKIVFVQTVKRTFDGMVIPWGQLNGYWAYRDPDALADGTIVDHIFCEKDPGYNGDDRGSGSGNQDSGQQGASQGNGTAVTDATMSDGPTKNDNFPTGKTKVLDEYETCAMCAVGNNPANWTSLGCIKWKYTRMKGDGTVGTAMLVSTMVETRSQTHVDATNRFATTHTSATTPSCPEDLPAGSCGNRVYNKKGPLVFHVNDNYKVESAGPNVKKGRQSPDSMPPSDPIGATLMACDYVLVPANETICIKRNTGSRLAEDGAENALISAQATFAECLQGGLETVESGICPADQHCGVLVRDCSNQLTFAAAAPLDSDDPETLILYTVNIDDVRGLVTIRNDPLSSGPIAAVDVYHRGPPIRLNPGRLITFAYRGLIRPCVFSEQAVLNLAPTSMRPKRVAHQGHSPSRSR
jgi:hypothetical protein